jgi:peroxin-3
MLSRVKTFVRNHWKKVVIGGAVVQIAGYGIRYAANRFIEYHTEQAQELWKKVEKRQHFENMESTFASSYIALIPSLRETFIRSLDVDSLTDSLKNGIANKLEIWDRLKVIAFSRILVTIYGTSLLSVLLRIQLSVIGGYLFQEAGTNQRQATMRNVDGVILSHVTAIDTDLQHKYLSLANYLVQGGMEELCAFVTTKVESVVGHLSLKQKVTISDLEEIFWSIVSAIKIEAEPGNTNTSLQFSNQCEDPTKHPWKYIFPVNILESQDYFRNTVQPITPHYEPPDLYRRLMYDTFDLLESDDVCGILHSFESHGISHFLDRLAESIQDISLQNSSMGDSVMESSVDGSGSSFANTNSVDHHNLFREIEVPVAKLIPIMNGVSLSSMTGSDPWITLLVNAESGSTLAANVYESFSTNTI